MGHSQWQFYIYIDQNNGTIFVLENIQEKYISMLVGLIYYVDDYVHLQNQYKKKILRGKYFICKY